MPSTARTARTHAPCWSASRERWAVEGSLAPARGPLRRPLRDPMPKNLYGIGRRVTPRQHTITGTKSAMQEPLPQQPARSRRGRKPKGVRVGTFVSLPVELRRAAEEIARREQLPLGDVITRIVAEGLGIPAPAYCYPATAQQTELPLTKAS